MNAKLTTVLCLCLASLMTRGQDLDTPNGYLDYIGQQYVAVSKEQWDYMKTMGRGKSAKKVEKRRLELARSILTAKRQIARMPGFQGDKTFRDSVVHFMNVSHLVINEDYAKIVDMEEVAEQSYDLMEAYLLAKEKANEKLSAASDVVHKEQDAFAARNNVRLIETETKLGEKLRKGSEVFQYYNKVFLIFFKSQKQEAYLLDAFANSDINGVEQNRSALLNYSKEGRESLKDYAAFRGDPSLSAICRQLLQFYSDEAENKIPVLVDYLVAYEKFKEIESAFKKIKPLKITQPDIDRYNNSVNELNTAINNMNETNEQLNKKRNKLIDLWNGRVNAFFNKHMP